MSALHQPAFPAPPPTRLLRPEPPLPQRLPRWSFVVLGVSALLRLFDDVSGADVWWLWGPPAAFIGCVWGAWAEERLYYRSSHRAGALRVLQLSLQSIAWVPGFLAALLLLVPAVGVIGLTLAVGSFWFSSASQGSFATMVVDRLLSSTKTLFRTRLTVAIFVMMVLSVVAGICAGAVALFVVNGAWAGDLTGSIKVTGDPKDIERGLAWVRAHPQVILAGAASLAAIIGVPSWLSTSGKLADAAMYRLRPLSRAFDAIAGGERDVRVEEGGSVDFIELNRKFNGMVQALADAERMEDAFGRYVSKKVLERIRAQHGEAVIPAQLRNASVFFADVRGYTALSERLPPEAVVALLNRYLAQVVELVEKHEGYLNKFIGDAVVVVFNGPVEQADHAERAVRCALDLQAMVARENKSGTFAEAGELKIGVGVATGPMVCGNVGGPSQMEYTVIGDTVNLSARLTSAAGPTEVWVSEATRQACTSAFAFEALPELKVKGKEKPVVPYRVVTA